MQINITRIEVNNSLPLNAPVSLTLMLLKNSLTLVFKAKSTINKIIDRAQLTATTILFFKNADMIIRIEIIVIATTVLES